MRTAPTMKPKQLLDMKLTQNKLRSIIREELRFTQGRTGVPKGTANYHIHQFIKKVANEFASRLQSAYEIQFEDAQESRMAVTADFKVYNNRQDMFKEGSLAIFDIGGEITVEVRGGDLGSSVSEKQEIINQTFGYSEAPLGEIDIVSSFQVLAGR